MSELMEITHRVRKISEIELGDIYKIRQRTNLVMSCTTDLAVNDRRKTEVVENFSAISPQTINLGDLA